MLYLVFLLLSTSIVFQVRSLNDEGHALLSLKRSIYRDPEESLNNWNSSDESPCTWNGVICKGQRVVSLSIPRKKLYGVLPSALGSLSELRRLNFRNNEFFGSLPVELFQVLGLQSLVLCGNSLSGQLPKEVGRLRFLQTLDLSDNFFNWSLPVSVLECKRLRALDLSHNNFTGGLLNGFGDSLVSLEKLDISFNQFNGSIPSDIGNLSSLQGTVDLSHNLFTGSIPASLGNLPEKVYIDLSYNNLCGPIPQNGSLINRGPTTFIGNPGLCGPPLKNLCSSDMPAASSPSSYPFMPSNYTPQVYDNAGKSGKASGLSKGAVIAIVVSNVIGMSLTALLLSYWYSRVCVKGKRDKNGHVLEKGVKRREDLLCFRNNGSETISENVEQCDIVPLDDHVTFDLDELLKASAFVIGKGRFGIVYKVVLEDGQTLAVRRLGEGGSQRFKEFRAEVEAIARIRHPNIVALRAYYWSVDEKLLIYDYITHGNLATAIHGKPGMVSFTPLTWSTRLKIIKGVAKGLFYLHEFSPKRYVHGDLRLSNILLGDLMEPKISDFGLGRLASIAERSPTPEKQQETLEKATSSEAAASSSSASMSYYQAPEALKVAKPSQKWDVYAFGVILLELITGRLPMVQVGTSAVDLVHWMQQSIEQKKPLLDVLDPYIIDDIGKEDEIIAVLKIAMACIHSSPERRTAMRQVIGALDTVKTSTD